MASPSDGVDDEPGVIVRSLDNAAVGVRIGERQPFEQRCVHYVVEVWAPGLTARVEELVAWIGDADLAAFLAELAADFRGWEGERTWQTHDGDLAVSAVFRSGGGVGLTWTVRPWPAAAGGWSARVTTWLEAGEQLSSLASDVEALLAGGRP